MIISTINFAIPSILTISVAGERKQEMVYILLAEGFEEAEAIFPLDLLRRAEIDVKTVGIGASKIITGSHGIPVIADISADGATDKIDMLILPGGMPGTTNLDISPDVNLLIDRTIKDGGFIAAICAAPSILGKRGLLKGKEAVCYPGFEKWLHGARISEKSVVRDDRIITAAGAGVAAQFGFELISALLSPETADKIKAAILI